MCVYKRKAGRYQERSNSFAQPSCNGVNGFGGKNTAKLRPACLVTDFNILWDFCISINSVYKITPMWQKVKKRIQ
jgi:hypothetical protein